MFRLKYIANSRKVKINTVKDESVPVFIDSLALKLEQHGGHPAPALKAWTLDRDPGPTNPEVRWLCSM